MAPFVGSSNVRLTCNYSSTGSKLKLDRVDGGPPDTFDSTGNFENNTGVTCTQWYVPLAMNVEQGIRSASVTVASDISAITPTTGDSHTL